MYGWVGKDLDFEGWKEQGLIWGVLPRRLNRPFFFERKLFFMSAALVSPLHVD